MNCRTVQNQLTDYLDAGSPQTLLENLITHLESCPECARYYDEAQRTLSALEGQDTVQPTSDFKERVMSQIYQQQTLEQQRSITIQRERGWQGWIFKPVTVIGLAVLLLTAFFTADLLMSPDGSRQGGPGIAVNSLIENAWANEQALFDNDGILHMVSQILVPATKNEALAKSRWFPMYTLDASGKPHFNQLSLPTDPGKGYTVLDEVWYDPGQKRYIRKIHSKDRTVFAAAFDGSRLYSTEAGPSEKSSIVGKPVGPEFKAPDSPIAFLGIYPGFANLMDEKNSSLVTFVEETGLEDGTEVRVLQYVMEQPPGAPENIMLFKINKANDTLAEIEWRIQGNSFLVVRRITTETVTEPGVPWNLEGVEIAPSPEDGQAAPGIQSDMIVPDVTVRHMAEKAEFETYLLSKTPSWCSGRTITDMLDIPSPPKRMFIIVYKASDERHIVIMQSATYNKVMGMLVKNGKLIYESPNGFKVWSTSQDKMGATIALQSARQFTGSDPAEDRIGYLLESPAGTFPAIAVNGTLSNDELHGLIDSFVAVKEYKE